LSITISFTEDFGVFKALGIAAAAAVIGLTCGWLTHQARFGSASQFGPFVSDKKLDPADVSLVRRSTPSDEAAKVEVVGGETYDFGAMEAGGEGKHAFIVRNTGTAPLELEIVGSTCKCTIGKLQDSSVAPGEQTEINLTWVARSDIEDFGQSAVLKTNDPTRGELNLKIRGRVISSMTMVPRSLNFGEVESGETIRLQAVIYSFSRTPIAAVMQSFSDPALNDLTTFNVKETSVEELGDSAYATATQAFEVNIEIAPGAPQGAIRENFTFGYVPKSAVDEDGNYEAESLSKFSAETTGKVVGPITMVESRKVFNSETGYIYTIGQVDPATAKPERANILLRGPNRNQIKLSIGDVEPARILHAEVGEPIGRSTTVLVPLTLWIDPEAKPIDRMGRSGDDFGIVWIKTDDPEVSPMRLRVRFIVPKK
jgi:hypothetical protein